MGDSGWVLLLAMLAVLTRELLWLSAGGILLSSLDDLCVDALWLSRLAGRSELRLPPRPEVPGRFALLVPAWDESAVIGPMLARLCAGLPDAGLCIFVGTYPNDPATRAAAEEVGDARIRVVVTERPGPTTKADCLNRLWQAVLAHEAAAGIRFKGVILHDAEDVVDQASLELYDRCLPGLAMVQLPVLPLVDRESPWVSGHYCDEFAEAHAKDMMARGLLGAPVPSAGVGTAICREALGRLAGADGCPFDPHSLTEDYEMGYRLHALGLKGAMVRARVGGRLVATRAYFPATVEAAVRQKSRWLTGIALAGWDRLGWAPGLGARWMLLRDRKALLTAGVAMAAYAAAVLLLAQLAARAWLMPGAVLPPLLGEEGSLLRLLLLVNAGLLGWRLLLRGWFTGAAYGWRQGLMALPRALFANGINFLAAGRAMERYRATVESDGTPPWGKTSHRFPHAAEAGANG